MADYKTFEDKVITVQNLEVKADLSEDDPEVEKVILHLPGENPSRITTTPQKKVVESKTINGYDAKDDNWVNIRLSEMPDVLSKINDKTDVGNVKVKATITRGIFQDDDGTRKNFWIRNSHIDGMEVMNETEKKSKTEENAEEYVEDQTNIETDVETEEVEEVEEVVFGEGDEL